MSWWWGTTGTFGVIAYMAGLFWYGIELFRNASLDRLTHGEDGSATAGGAAS